MDGGLEGKVAVVTGAGRMRSIGRSIAVAFARAGCNVVLTGSGRDPATYPAEERAAGWRDVASVADEVRALGVGALDMVADAADAAAAPTLLAATLKRFGRVDFVVNNAGAARGRDRVPVVDLDTDAWANVLDVNLNGTFYMCRAFGRELIRQGQGGAIVNISSIAGKLFPPNTAAYAASKAAIQALSAAMAQEVGQHGIRVNSVCPGVIDTHRMDDLDRGEAWQRLIRTRIPLGRAGTGDDIASIVCFLCSDAGAWITGQAINVDGGHVVQH
jgi:NAD(P)-dependent dehydrogenase (short-subunit alcohol dehydrogenase family)